MSWTTEAPSLAGLEPEARQTLDRLRPSDVAKDAVLFRPGEVVKGYVIVLNGKIGVHLVGPSGRDILLYRVAPGQSCIQSTLGLMGGEDYSAEAVAEEDTRLVLLPRTAFLGLIDTSPGFRALVFAAFADRMQTMMRVLERVAFQRVEARLAAHILSQADGSGVLRATQSEIATATGTVREVISRRLDSLKKTGCIAHERGIVTILNPERLRQLAEDSSV